MSKKRNVKKIINHSYNLSGKSIGGFIFGVEDGLIGTFGLVVGITSANTLNKIVILAGFAEMFADAISMTAGSYLSTKSQKEYYDKILKRVALGGLVNLECMGLST